MPYNLFSLWTTSRYLLIPCSSSRFPFAVVRLVSCHSDVRLLSLFFSIAPCCWPFLSTFLPPLPFLDLFSYILLSQLWSSSFSITFLFLCYWLVIHNTHGFEGKIFLLPLSGMMTAQVESGICMVEKDCISIFTTDGKDYVTSLPFQVSFSLDLLWWMHIQFPVQCTEFTME